MVRKWRNTPKPDQSSQIASPNDETAQGTLPSVERRCIPKLSQDYEANPAPSPLLTTSSHLPPSGGFNPRTAYHLWCLPLDYVYDVSLDTWKERFSLLPTQPMPSIRECSSLILDNIPADLGDLPDGTSSNTPVASEAPTTETFDGSDGWCTDDSSDLSSDDEYPSNHLFDNTWVKSHASSNWQTHKRPQDNPLLDSLADNINGIIFGLEEDKDMIHLRWSLLDSMSNAPDSIQAFQHTIIRMLNTLLNENLFISSAPSMIAPCELQATLLTHAHIGNSMCYVASGENSNYPLNTTYFPSFKSPSDTIADPSGLMQQPPHMSRTAADDPGAGTSTLSHVTQKTRKCSWRQHWQASTETKKETRSESLLLLHGADTVEERIAGPW